MTYILTIEFTNGTRHVELMSEEPSLDLRMSLRDRVDGGEISRVEVLAGYVNGGDVSRTYLVTAA